jgi:hypothetical protein
LQTDVRRALPTGNNLMIQRSLHRVFADVEELVNWMKDAGEGAP